MALRSNTLQSLTSEAPVHQFTYRKLPVWLGSEPTDLPNVISLQQNRSIEASISLLASTFEQSSAEEEVVNTLMRIVTPITVKEQHLINKMVVASFWLHRLYKQVRQEPHVVGGLLEKLLEPVNKAVIGLALRLNLSELEDPEMRTWLADASILAVSNELSKSNSSQFKHEMAQLLNLSHSLIDQYLQQETQDADIRQMSSYLANFTWSKILMADHFPTDDSDKQKKSPILEMGIIDLIRDLEDYSPKIDPETQKVDADLFLRAIRNLMNAINNLIVLDTNGSFRRAKVYATSLIRIYESKGLLNHPFPMLAVKFDPEIKNAEISDVGDDKFWMNIWYAYKQSNREA